MSLEWIALVCWENVRAIDCIANYNQIGSIFASANLAGETGLCENVSCFVVTRAHISQSHEKLPYENNGLLELFARFTGWPVSRANKCHLTTRLFARLTGWPVSHEVSRYFRLTNQTLNFIVEPFLPHASNTEYYICITSARDGDNILFTHEGGVDIGDVDAKGLVLNIPVTEPFPSREKIADTYSSM